MLNVGAAILAFTNFFFATYTSGDRPFSRLISPNEVCV